MLFPTLDFAIFFFTIFIVSWLLIDKLQARKNFLLIASYFFYGYWDWRLMFLLAGSSLLNYWAGRALEIESDQQRRKVIVWVAVAINLTILGFFKYYGFFLDQLSIVLYEIGWERDLPFLEIVLPIGISFFTFQGISYVIDVSRRKIAPVSDPVDLFLYISFFPQLVAGPIVRAADFLPQLARRPQLTQRRAAFGLTLILFGLFKKMVIAHYLAEQLVDPAFADPWSRTGADLWFAVYGYAVQIYCDFSGYSDIAIGAAALLGYRFAANFDQPYRASSVREFWRRWHISLSSWLRDYLYIPLGGSRGGELKTARNLLLTMGLGGLWHGASWAFLAWGLFHGLVMCTERLFSTYRSRSTKLIAAGVGPVGVDIPDQTGRRGGWLSRWLPQAVSQRLTAALGVLLTFHLVCFSWILFRSEGTESLFAYLNGLTDWSQPVELTTPFLTAVIGLSLAMHFAPSDLAQRCATVAARGGWLSLGILFGVGMSLILSVAPEGVAPFIYFQF